jgi:hypothetical protein
MEIKTKYNIGQKVYFLTGLYHFNIIEHRCPNCSGKYKKKMDGGEWHCSKCKEGRIEEEKESLSIEIDKEPFTVSGIVISIDEKGLNEGERASVTRHNKDKSTTYFHFIANFDDKREDDWTYADKDRGVKKGIKFKRVHLTKKSALAEFNRVEEILNNRGG